MIFFYIQANLNEAGFLGFFGVFDSWAKPHKSFNIINYPLTLLNLNHISTINFSP